MTMMTMLLKKMVMRMAIDVKVSTLNMIYRDDVDRRRLVHVNAKSPKLGPHDQCNPKC